MNKNWGYWQVLGSVPHVHVRVLVPSPKSESLVSSPKTQA